MTPQAELKYYVYISPSANIGTEEDCNANGFLLNGGGTADMLSYTAVDLSPDTQYWFNVVVEDKAGNKKQYGMMSMITALGSAPTLKITIDEAQALLDGAETGDAPGQYPQDEADTLETAIADAQSVYDNLPDDPDKAVEKIDKAIRDLLVAMARFEESVIPEEEAPDPDPAASWVSSSGCDAGGCAFGALCAAAGVLFSLKRKDR
jgi:hypothetical protein